MYSETKGAQSPLWTACGPANSQWELLSRSRSRSSTARNISSLTGPPALCACCKLNPSSSTHSHLTTHAAVISRPLGSPPSPHLLTSSSFRRLSLVCAAFSACESTFMDATSSSARFIDSAMPLSDSCSTWQTLVSESCTFSSKSDQERASASICSSSSSTKPISNAH